MQYMSQVIRKYSNGKPIKLDDSKLFQREGFGAYKREDIANNLAKGLEQFIADEKMNEKDAQIFRQIVGQAIEGTRNGQFTKMDTSGIHNTMNWNSSGVTEGKKFLGINVGGQRAFDKSAKTNDGRNNALNALNRFYTKTLDSMSTYNYDDELKAYNDKNPKSKYNANTFLTDEISRRWYGGNGIDWNNFSKNRTEQERKNLIADIFNNSNFDEIFNKYDWSGSNVKGIQDLANLFRAFGSKISDNKLDNNDYNTFAALGGTDLDQFITGTKKTEVPTEKPIEGRVGKADTTWNNSEYDRTVDDKGQYHIYKKGTGEEVSGILPGNVFEGTGNKYAFNGNIYDDSNLPEQYRQDIDRARQAQLGNYTQLTDNNPFTKMLKEQGYNYITNLSQFASGIGNNILYGIYSNPSDVNGKTGYYLKDPTTGKAINGRVEYNNTLGQYQFIGNNGSVTNLGTYNKNGTLTNQGTTFVNYNDTSENNQDTLFSAWLRNSDLNNPASDAYKMVQNTLSRWIASKKSPFVNYGNAYQWKSGNDIMNVRKNDNGQWEWKFNSGFDDSKESQDKRLEALLKIPVNQRTREINDEIRRLQGYKNGGIISAQLGVKFTKVDDKPQLERPELSKEQIERNEKAHQSFTGRSNISLGNNKEITDAGGVLKTSDKVRLGAAMADLASVGLGFIPGANLLSTGIGVASSVTEFGADWASDGPDWGDVGRLGMNLGMDALSLIPIGKTWKATKALGKIRKSIPLIMTAVNSANFLDPSIRAEYNKTLSKLTSGDIKSLNTGDFKNLSAIASTVLMGRNLAKSHKGFWNTNTTDSGKRRVTAMIDGKQQSLELDEAFFQNTKGKNQVQELKSKFAEQYNKQNKLEGDKAIKPENVAVDTKYFGRRPQSEKVAGTKGNGNWVTNNMVGRYFLGYEDPSVPKGLDAYILNYKKKQKVSTDTPTNTNVSSATTSTSTSTKETGLVPTGKRNEFEQFNNEVQGYEKAWRQKEAERINQNRLKIDDSRDWRAGTIPREGSTSKFEGVDAKQLRAVHKISDFIGEVANEMKKPAINRNNLPVPYKGSTVQLPNIQTLIATSPKVKYTGIQEGIENATKQRIAKDIYNTKTQRRVQQNTETVARRQAEEAKRNVDKAIIMATIPSYRKALQGAPYKAKQTMYNKLFNQRYYDMQDAIRNKELPHKKSNKKKKTSKDNKVKRREWGGLIFKDGGLIPKFENPAGPIRMQAKSKNYFDRNTGLSGYNLGADIDEFLKHGTAEDYVIGFNGREDNYDALVKASGGTYGNRNYISNPLATTVQSGMLTYNPGFDRYIRQNIQGYGVTEGQGTGTDQHFGDRTWERTLGRNITAEQAKYYNDTYLRQRGIEMYDKGDGGYRLRLLNPITTTSTTPSNTSTTSPVDTTSSGSQVSSRNGIIGTPNEQSEKSKRNFRFNPADLLSLNRLIGTFDTNNKMAELSRTKPFIEDPFQKSYLVHGDAASQALAHKYGTNLLGYANRNTTSDATNIFAKQLEAYNTALPIFMQGDAKDYAERVRTRSLGQQIDNENKANLVTTSNNNSNRILASKLANNRIEASRIGANFEKGLSPFLAGIENRYRQRKALLNEVDLQEFINNKNSEYQVKLAELQQKYKDNIPEQVRQRQILDKEYKQLISDYKKSLLDSPFLIYSKSGGKLGYKEKMALQRAKDFNKRLLEDNKRFHKDIMESKREYNKLLKHASSFTAALIKKGLNL